MTEVEILRLIEGGEKVTVEFKKSTNEITKDVYDTVCSFSNWEGGHIFLGIEDDGTVKGGYSRSRENEKRFYYCGQ